MAATGTLFHRNLSVVAVSRRYRVGSGGGRRGKGSSSREEGTNWGASPEKVKGRPEKKICGARVSRVREDDEEAVYGIFKSRSDMRKFK